MESNETILLQSLDRRATVRVVANEPEQDQWLTAREVADLKGWELATVRSKMIRGHFGELKRKGAFWLINRDALEGVTVRRYTRGTKKQL